MIRVFREIADRELENHATLFDLRDEQRIIAAAALRAYDRIPLEGACYRLSAFIYMLLKLEFGIFGRPVVGWVNDGTQDLFASHAWFSYDGTITDIAIARASRPDTTPPGAVLILDRIAIPGHAYTYHKKRDADALRAQRQAASESPSAAAFVEHKEREHAMVERFYGDDASMRAFLDGAPDGLDYESLRGRVLDR